MLNIVAGYLLIVLGLLFAGGTGWLSQELDEPRPWLLAIPATLSVVTCVCGGLLLLAVQHYTLG